MLKDPIYVLTVWGHCMELMWVLPMHSVVNGSLTGGAASIRDNALCGTSSSHQVSCISPPYFNQNAQNLQHIIRFFDFDFEPFLDLWQILNFYINTQMFGGLAFRIMRA